MCVYMYTVDPHYSQISYLCICLPAKFVIPKSVLCHFCGQSQRGIKRQKISAATCKHMFSTEVKLVSSLPTCFSSQTINKCSFHNLLGVMFFTFCVFCWWLLKMAPKCGAEVMASVPKCKKAVMCFMKKIHIR